MGEMAVALLRGINVGGKNVIPMKALAEVFAGAGCTGVKTYIQSGNVVFRPANFEVVAGHAETLAGHLEVLAGRVRDEIARRFGLKVPVVMRSAAEMKRVVEGNPFVGDGVAAEWMHVMFLADVPSEEMVAGLDANRVTGAEEFVVKGWAVYLHLPYGAAKTKLTNAYFDARLKTVGTQRNWRTVLMLAEMAGAAIV